MTEKKKVGGLAGVSAGATALCTVGKEGAGLTYRGYDIYDLVENANFEEVAYLLMHGHLPTQAEFDAFIESIKSMRGLPDQVKQVLEMIPPDSHPMDVLRSGVSILGNIEPEGDFANQLQVADRLLAVMPSMLLYWHRFHIDGTRIDTQTADDSVAGHFLHMLLYATIVATFTSICSPARPWPAASSSTSPSSRRTRRRASPAR